jgi:thiosulfate/3-mercaptopyruvate sulfurtransferase
MIKPFIDIEWVEGQRDEIVLVDCRWYLDERSGRAAYDDGHIPGAVFVDLDTALTHHGDPAEAGRHPLAAPVDFAAAMGALGIGDDDVVIAYDDAGGVIAARLVWMLRVTGHEAALLDGGIGAWQGELEVGPGPARGEHESPPGAFSIAVGENDRQPGGFIARPWPVDRLATIEEVASAAGSAGGPDRPPAGRDPGTLSGAAVALIDARQRERYLGEPDDVDPRAGHIPGARSVPCRENLDPDGRLLPVEQLRARFDFAAGADVISYCGSGVTACHNLLAMEQAGLGPGRLFPGSWSQWSRDPARPAETTEPGTP